MDTEIEEGIQGTGKFLRMHADMEHDAENGVCIESLRDGRWLVGGVVIVDSIDNALELAA
jgi:hypothetical protein